MDGSMIKTASRYVGTSTIIRHLETRDNLLDGINKEAGVFDWALSQGKKILTRPQTIRGTAGRMLGRAKEGLIGDAGEAGRRFFSPVEGVRKGWREMSGSGSRIRELEKKHKFYGKMKKEQAPPRVVDKLRKDLESYTKKTEHLDPSHSTPLKGAWREGGVKGTMEELSRRGVTGQGDFTKYLPVGEKSLVAGFGASEIPGIVNAPEATPTGEGSKLERLGSLLGGSAGWIAGTGTGFLPSVALYMAAAKAGSSAGRVADRMRAGAPLGEAATAPSPREAREQLAKIYQTYGG